MLGGEPAYRVAPIRSAHGGAAYLHASGRAADPRRRGAAAGRRAGRLCGRRQRQCRHLARAPRPRRGRARSGAAGARRSFGVSPRSWSASSPSGRGRTSRRGGAPARLGRGGRASRHPLPPPLRRLGPGRACRRAACRSGCPRSAGASPTRMPPCGCSRPTIRSSTRPNRIGPEDWAGWDKERGPLLRVRMGRRPTCPSSP